jgi:hypothetical protein
MDLVANFSVDEDEFFDFLLTTHGGFELKCINRYFYNHERILDDDHKTFSERADYMVYRRLLPRLNGFKEILYRIPCWLNNEYCDDNQDEICDFLHEYLYTTPIDNQYLSIYLVLMEYVMLFPALFVKHNNRYQHAISFGVAFLCYLDDQYALVREKIIQEIKFGRTADLIALFKLKCSHIPLWQEYEKELTKVLNYVPEKIHIIDLANDLDSINSGTCPNIILLAFEHFDSEPLQSLLQNDYIRHLRIDEDEDEEEESDVPIEWKLRMDQKIIANRAHYIITMALLCAQERTPSMRTSCWIWQDIHKYLLY